MTVINSEVCTSMFVEKDYSIFTLLDGNRTTNPIHLNRLEKSVLKNGYLKCPIIVNNKMEIIDGQHRYEVAKKLGLPIYFIVNDEYGIKEVEVLNTNMKNWHKEDYLKMYCEQKKPEYLLFDKFMKHFSYKDKKGKVKYTFNISCVEELLSDNGGDKYFETGDLKTRSYDATLDEATYIKHIGIQYNITKYKSLTFVRAMRGVLRHPNFQKSHFSKKLMNYSRMFVGCSAVGDYREVIQEIYNKRSRNKVNII